VFNLIRPNQRVEGLPLAQEPLNLRLGMEFATIMIFLITLIIDISKIPKLIGVPITIIHYRRRIKMVGFTQIKTLQSLNNLFRSYFAQSPTSER
jgi:hypothetical protein